jgi:hypothetical protein
MPDVVPIGSGSDADLLNPHPGAPGLASRPPGAEASSAGQGHGGQTHEQGGVQEVSFGGGGGHRGQGQGEPPDAPDPSGGAVAPPPPVADPQPDPPAPPPPDPRPVHHDHHGGGGDDRHGKVSLDPRELADFARAMSRTAAEYREVAGSIRAAEAPPQPAEAAERVRVARQALEQLADELEAGARDLELRAGMIDELSDSPGVRDADVVSTVFSMKVNPLDPPGGPRRG